MRLVVVLGCSLLATAAMAQTAKQRDFIEHGVKALVLVEKCGDFQVNNRVLYEKAKAVGLSDTDIGPTGRFAKAVGAIEASVRAEFASLSDLTRCSVVAPALFGKEGSAVANLLTDRTSPPPATRASANSGSTAGNVTSEPARLVAGIDMQLAPRRFIGQRVEMRGMRCLNADTAEFRCIATDGSVMAVFTPKVVPAESQQHLERNCATFRELQQPACRLTIRFTPLTHDSDTVSGAANRTVVVAREIEVVPTQRSRR
jgi:hypothetical protein